MLGGRTQPVLPAWLRWGFPPLLLVVVYAARVIDPVFYKRWIESELGLIELATPIIALVAAGLAWRVFDRLRRGGHAPALLLAWIAGLGCACVYLAGEELSWGQQLFHWSTPESIKALNDQHETNLHNMSSWFDQKPRLLLEIWVVFGGILLPASEWKRGARWREGSAADWFWPTRDTLPTALLAELIRVPPRLKDAFGWDSLPLEIRYSEPQEYYFALFLALYLYALYRRLAPTQA